MKRNPSGFGGMFRRAGSAVSEAFEGLTSRLTRTARGNGRTYAGGRTRGARQQGPTPVLGAPGTPIRSSAASNAGARGTQQPQGGPTKRKAFGRRIVNKKRFAVSMSAVVAAVLVPVIVTSALEGGMFTSHGVSVQVPAAAQTDGSENETTLGAYATGVIVEQAPAAAPPQDTGESAGEARSSSVQSEESLDEVQDPQPDDEGEENAVSAPSEEEEDNSGEEESSEDSSEESAEPKASEETYRPLAPGETNDAVIELQQRLMELNYMENDEPTNYYGSQTQQAVAYFQRKNGLDVDGYAGPDTQDVLFSGEAKVYTVADGAEGADVWEIQERLADLGYDVNVTGYYGSQTSDAVRYFQRMNGITDDGSVGTSTKDVLFSDWAEPAEPKPEPEPEEETAAEEGTSEAAAHSEESAEESSSSESSSSEESSSSSESSSGSEESSSHEEESYHEEEEEESYDPPVSNSSGVEAFIDVACAQEGKPYVLGGKGPNTFDCSGLIYYALNASGYDIGYMTSGGWASSGFPSVSWDNLRRGDVVCMHGHVAVYLGDGMMCDASSSNGQMMIRSMGNWARSNFICGKRVF